MLRNILSSDSFSWYYELLFIIWMLKVLT
jgi:hypothetical protein